MSVSSFANLAQTSFVSAALGRRCLGARRFAQAKYGSARSFTPDWRWHDSFTPHINSRGRSIAVVGGGPAGVCVAATAALRDDCTSIIFFDVGGFKAGMLQNYLTVPGNTKLEALNPLLTSGAVGEFARRFDNVAASVQGVRNNSIPTPAPLKRAARSVPHEQLTDIEASQLFDPDQDFDPCELGWPQLGDMAAVFREICIQLRQMQHVTMVDAPVTHIAHEHGSGWSVNNSHHVDAVVLCQGAIPKTLPDIGTALPEHSRTRILSLEVALDRSALQRAIAPSDRIGVVGNSHTGALVLQNIAALGHDMERKVRLFGLNKVMLARWSSRASGYLYSSTGLKGIAAAFVMDELASEGFATSVFGRQAGRDALEAALQREELDVVVVAAGFKPRPYPALRINGVDQNQELLTYNAEDGSLRQPEGHAALEGLYEVGINQPEYYIDGDGASHPQYAFTGGPETKREGWQRERVVGWNLFDRRATQVVDAIMSCRDRTRNGC